MKWSPACVWFLLVASPVSATLPSQFQVVGSTIYDPGGRPFIIRGVNVQGPNSWWYSQPRDIAADAAMIAQNWGFNAIRLNGDVLPENLWWTDHRNNDLDRLIQAYTSRHVVVIFEAHDRTGDYFQNTVASDGSVHNDLTVLNDWYRTLAQRYKDNPYVWFNVMNEPGRGMPDIPKWLDVHQSVIHTIRDEVGASNMIVVDGTHFGQDTGANWDASLIQENQSAILSHGRDLLAFNHEDYANILFSFHVYSEWRLGGQTKMADYIDRVQARGLALIAGEYNADSPETRTLLSLADQKHLGRIAWHWQDDGFHFTTDGGGWLINDPVHPSNLSSYGQLVWDDTHAISPAPSAARWDADASGQWSEAANWTGSAPQGVDAIALLGTGITSPRTITLDLPVTLGHLPINSSQPYTLEAKGLALLTFQTVSGSADITVQAGAHTIAASLVLASPILLLLNSETASLTLRGNITGSCLTKTGPGSLVLEGINSYVGGTTVENGTLRFATPAARPSSDILTINQGETSTVPTIVIVGAGGSDLQACRAALHDSFDPFIARWTNLGTIRSLSAAVTPGAAIGYLTGAQFNRLHAVTSMAPDDLLLMFTNMGDADLDGRVTLNDYAQLDAAFLQPVANPTWINGDFNYDGTVDYRDYALIDAAYQQQAGSLATDLIHMHASALGDAYWDALAAVQQVPEPASAGFLLAGIAGFLRRRPRALPS